MFRCKVLPVPGPAKPIRIHTSPCVFNADNSGTQHYMQEERRPASQRGLLTVQELGHFLGAALV